MWRSQSHDPCCSHRPPRRVHSSRQSQRAIPGAQRCSGRPPRRCERPALAPTRASRPQQSPPCPPAWRRPQVLTSFWPCRPFVDVPIMPSGQRTYLHRCLWSRTSGQLHTCARSWDWCTGAQGKTAASSKNTRALLRPGKAAAATGTASVSGMSQQRMVRPCCPCLLPGVCLFMDSHAGHALKPCTWQKLKALARESVHAAGIRRKR